MDLSADILTGILAAVLFASAMMKLSHRPAVLEMYDAVGVSGWKLDVLAVILLVAAAGLVVGFWIRPLAIVTPACLVLYFLLAVGAHARSGQGSTAGPAAVLLVASAAVLVTELI